MRLTDIVKWDTNSRVWKRAYKKAVCLETGKCARCPWHGGENRGLSRQPRTDKYKNKR